MPLTPAFFSTISNVFFDDASDVDNYFVTKGGKDFITWFNTRAANKDNWGKVGLRDGLAIASDSMAHSRFNSLWSNESIQAVFGAGKISLLQFAALQSIIINETGGKLLPLTEAVGSAGHPGIAYAFDKIPGIKKSYNTLPGNKTCLQSFNDANYNKAFGKLPLADKLKNTASTVWAGEVYPQASVPSSANPTMTGYVLEADFFKFRGRGFIQTTGRSNYAKLVSYVMSYTGKDPVITNVKASWSNLSHDTDTLASMSTNANWDDLFQKSSCLIAGRAICVHNESCGRYVQAISASDQSAAEKSLFNMGLRISGGKDYALLFQNRVMQLLNLLA
ncbi:MAG: hypothetical protein INR73_06555 [Williamsia sp.]|nr:hypothetical protein [Williamsia sp.]